MEDFFKKFIYTGVGWISLTGDKLKKLIDAFIEEGKLSEKDGKQIVDEFIKNAETKKEELEVQFDKLVNQLISSFSFATINEIADLNTRISELEKALNKKKPTTKKPTQKKSKAKPSSKDSEQKES
ncbi:MAG: hypothetical protein JXR51_08530 [Bacteroidales bacterium]|nr:hypothetical protein [Bacteroidales bacterium]MBN2757208.1 hypothetical protein [Bacteroidales bacterium]